VWLYPVATVLDVLSTANHYMLDVVTAPAVVVLAYAIALAPSLARRAWPRPYRLRKPTAGDIPRALPRTPEPACGSVPAQRAPSGSSASAGSVPAGRARPGPGLHLAAAY
jgi:hypothetical protein